MKPIKKVILKDEKYEDGYSELLAKNSENGDLVIDGCDAGELAKEMFGDWDYEYWLTIPEKFKETIMLRARAKITSHFIHPGFRPALPDPQLQNPRNSSLFLRFCSLGSNKDDLNPCA